MIVEIIEKMNDCLNVYLIIVVSQWNEGQDQRVLHLDFIQENVLAPGVDIGVKEEWAWNRAEEKHVQEDKEKEEDFEPLRDAEGQELVVWEGIVAACDIDDKDHLAQGSIVVRKGVCCSVWRNGDESAAHQCKDQNHDKFEDEED